MKKELGFLITVGVVVFTCGSKDHSESADEISGAYVREYSFKVVNPETGAEIGMRTIRDTIFVRPLDEKYQISNHKWGKNDYDNDGWTNMEHSDDRPIPSMTASFNQDTQTLIFNSLPILFFDSQSHTIRKQLKRESLFKKI